MTKKCIICEYARKVIHFLLEKKVTFEAMENNPAIVCDYFPSLYKNPCLAFMGNYGKDLIHRISRAGFEQVSFI